MALGPGVEVNVACFHFRDLVGRANDNVAVFVSLVIR
jgi:hypothetical protein